MSVPAYNQHDLGDLVKVSAVFKNAETQVALDPEVVKLSVRPPSGTVTTYTYLDDATITKSSTGNYAANIDANEAGRWSYRWWSTGNGQAAEESFFEVLAAQSV